MSHQYNVSLKWNAERVGEVSSPELNSKIEVATPPQFPKGVEALSPSANSFHTITR